MGEFFKKTANIIWVALTLVFATLYFIFFSGTNFVKIAGAVVAFNALLIVYALLSTLWQSITTTANQLWGIVDGVYKQIVGTY